VGCGLVFYSSIGVGRVGNWAKHTMISEIDCRIIDDSIMKDQNGMCVFWNLED